MEKRPGRILNSYSLYEFIFSIMDQNGFEQLHAHAHSEHILFVQSGELTISNENESHVVSTDRCLLKHMKTQANFVDWANYRRIPVLMFAW